MGMNWWSRTLSVSVRYWSDRSGFYGPHSTTLSSDVWLNLQNVKSHMCIQAMAAGLVFLWSCGMRIIRGLSIRIESILVFIICLSILYYSNGTYVWREGSDDYDYLPKCTRLMCPLLREFGVKFSLWFLEYACMQFESSVCWWHVKVLSSKKY